MLDFLPKNLTFVDKTIRPQVLYDYNRKIVLTTSGMGSYGPAQVYLPEYVARKDALIHFTGYVAEGTLGRKLKDTPHGDTVEIGGLVVRKRADVEYTTEFSAHAKADEMIRFLQQFHNLKLVLLNHGEIDSKEAFARRILDEVETKQLGIIDREYLFRVNPYGFQKSLSTKFK
jgi:Cft2 family RNA processing exonuclease